MLMSCNKNERLWDEMKRLLGMEVRVRRFGRDATALNGHF